MDYNLIEIPRYLLPNTVAPGSVLRVSIVHDVNEEEKRRASLEKVEKEIKGRQMGKGTKILE